MKTLDQIITYKTSILSKYIIFNFCHTVKYHYGDINGYLDAKKSPKFWSCNNAKFHVSKKIIQTLTGIHRVNGKRARLASICIDRLPKEKIIYTDSCTIHYSSGKTYKILSGYRLTDDYIKEISRLIGTSSDPLDIRSDFYTQDDRDTIMEILQTSKKDDKMDTDDNDDITDNTDTTDDIDITPTQTYTRLYDCTMSHGKFSDLIGVEISLRKRDYINWLTNGHYTRNSKPKMDILQRYSRLKFGLISKSYGYETTKKIDNIWYLTEGEYITETVPEYGYEQ